MRIENRRSLQASDDLLSYPTPLGPTPLGQRPTRGWRERCARLLAAVAARRRERCTAAELAALSDRMLNDIGLTRADLPLPPRRRWVDDLR